MSTSQGTVVSDPALYERVYRRTRTYLHRMVNLCGVDIREVEDATSSILVRMMEKDGLADFTGEATDDRLRVFVAAYFRLGARAEYSRLQTYWDRCTSCAIGPPSVVYDEYFEDADSCKLFDDLAALFTGDALAYFRACAEHQTHAQARASLVESGWESNRIRRAIREVRSAVKKHLCTTS